MQTEQELSFDDLTLREVPVQLGGRAYVLREATVEAACRYRNAVLRAGKLGPDGKVAYYDGLADVEPLLVSLCLVDPATRETVPLATVRGWPSRRVQVLFRWIKEHSELDQPETAEALERQIHAAQAKLARVQQNGEPAKNARSATATASP
jgi:hypothetical protein